MHKIICVVLMVFGFVAVSQGACNVEGTELEINETIFIKDDALYKKAIEFFISKNYSEKEAIELADSSDYVGKAIVCREVLKVIDGKIVKTGRGELVFTELYSRID